MCNHAAGCTSLQRLQHAREYVPALLRRCFEFLQPLGDDQTVSPCVCLYRRTPFSDTRTLLPLFYRRDPYISEIRFHTLVTFDSITHIAFLRISAIHLSPRSDAIENVKKFEPARGRFVDLSVRGSGHYPSNEF